MSLVRHKAARRVANRTSSRQLLQLHLHADLPAPDGPISRILMVGNKVSVDILKVVSWKDGLCSSSIQQ